MIVVNTFARWCSWYAGLLLFVGTVSQTQAQVLPDRNQALSQRDTFALQIDRLSDIGDALFPAEKLRVEEFASHNEIRRQNKPRWKPAVAVVESSSANEQDSLTLVALYQSMAGASWTDASNWLSGPVATWAGITVDEEGRVISIALPGNGLSGSLPVELGQLTALEQLDLSENNVSGSMPAAMASLDALKMLDLSVTGLEGSIPEEIGQLSNLTHLILWGNKLSGSIPTSLGELSGLQEMWLFQNRLEGLIPDDLGSLSQLSVLYLDQNQLTGSIPAALVGASNLTELFLDFNQLTGEIPPILSALPSLISLSLGHNQLTGEIPVELGDLQQLKFLDLSFNGFTGRIPESFSFITPLTSLILSGNQLTGDIPQGLEALFNLTRLHLAGNQLSGEMSPTLGVNLRNLTELDVSHNQLEGEAPASLGFMGILRYLDMSHNRFSGGLPLLDLNFQLREVYLNDNAFSGPIENSFANLELLTDLNLSNNQLTGSIPRVIGVHQILERLNLQQNALSGELPDTIERLVGLKQLNLWGNQLSGSLPAELASLTSLQIADLGNNHFSGAIPDEVGRLPELFLLLLDANELSGAVPSSFQELENLVGLSLRDNELSDLPDLSGLALLDTVDVSENRLAFEDIVPNIDAAGGAINYAPQKPTPLFADREGAGMRYHVRVGGPSNVYSWLRNDTPIDGEESDELLLGEEDGTMMDLIRSEITNPGAPALTLESNTVRTDAVLDRIELLPDSVSLVSSDSVQFAYLGFDQFDEIRFFTASWTAGGGTLGAEGWYVAGDTSGTYEVRIQNIDGSVFGVAEVIVDGIVEVNNEVELPAKTELTIHGIYPNPFSSSSAIAFELPAPSSLEFRVYDTLGREVWRRQESMMPVGSHTLQIDAADWASGMYFFRIRADHVEAAGSMIKVD